MNTKKVPVLRFRGFSDEWVLTKLGSLDLYVSDGNYGEMYPKISEMQSSGVPFIRANNIKNGHLVWDDMKYIGPELHKVLTSGHLESNDILITTRGDIGAIAYVTEEFDGSNINAQICLLRAGKDLDTKYLFQYLGTQQGKAQFEQLQSGSALKQLPKGKLALVEIGITSKSEQGKIAGFLGVVDDKISGLQSKKEILQKYKKGATQSIFSQKIRFKNKNDNDYPEWQKKKLGELGKTYNGLTGKTALDFGEGSPFITYKQIFDSSIIDKTKFAFVKVDANEKQSMAKSGDIFFTTSSETPFEVGFTSVLLDDIENLYLNSFCFGYRANSHQVFLPKFAQFLFRSPHFRRLIVKLAQGSTRFNMSKNELMKLSVNLPAIEEQQKIADFLTTLDVKIELTERELGQAKTFKKALLQQMFV